MSRYLPDLATCRLCGDLVEDLAISPYGCCDEYGCSKCAYKHDCKGEPKYCHRCGAPMDPKLSMGCMVC